MKAEGGPCGNPLFLNQPADQLVSQCNRGRLPLLFVADTHQPTLFIIHERQVRRRGKSTRRKFDRRAHINQRNVFHDQSIKVVGGLPH